MKWNAIPPSRMDNEPKTAGEHLFTGVAVIVQAIMWAPVIAFLVWAYLQLFPSGMHCDQRPNPTWEEKMASPCYDDSGKMRW
jgi:hypothetical protein